MNSERLIGTLRSIGAFLFSRYALRFSSRQRLEAWQARRLAHFMAQVLPRGQRFKSAQPAHLQRLPFMDKQTLMGDFAGSTPAG